MALDKSFASFPSNIHINVKPEGEGGVWALSGDLDIFYTKNSNPSPPPPEQNNRVKITEGGQKSFDP